ncbi:winged helix-turn-helix transcriptional regulator [Vallitalea okinawensis]|uniref:winged helix-turn-helix transcriptional regulator n=1 Tax=Vallitalea okinawensis TaxID=2078660 RepID=UPI000CFCD135|nr:helix-turn-helix domain-containing protein [Vallitalea okinawensis]
MPHNNKEYSCSIDLTIDLISGKWSMWVLYVLQNEGTIRFGELRKRVKGITEKMLIQQLKKYESFDIVHRKVYNQVPPKVEYSLTEYGNKLMPIIDLLFQWGDEFMESHEDLVVVKDPIKFKDLVEYSNK